MLSIRKGDFKAMQQVEQMRADGRVDMYAEADYSEGTTAYMWIISKIQSIADRIRKTEKDKMPCYPKAAFFIAPVMPMKH